jgi:predicted RNA-binding Zn-ribbon protein involved in translation (DUF1610 family)
MVSPDKIAVCQSCGNEWEVKTAGIGKKRKCPLCGKYKVKMKSEMKTDEKPPETTPPEEEKTGEQEENEGEVEEKSRRKEENSPTSPRSPVTSPDFSSGEKEKRTPAGVSSPTRRCSSWRSGRMVSRRPGPPAAGCSGRYGV